MATAPWSSCDGVAEDEWEYEYDPTETEDLYFTLDLTTHVADALEPKEEEGEEEENDDGNHDTHISDAQNGNADANPNAQVAKDPRPPPRSQLQILDLHTTNPLVKLDEGVYSCCWSTDLGTQFHIAQAGHIPNPRRAGHVLDIVGLSQARLTGKPGSLTVKNATGEGQHDATTPDLGNTMDDEPGSADESNPVEDTHVPQSSHYGQPLVIPREDCRTPTAVQQASFLERLSQIKLKKGENDPVPIYSVKIHREPANKAELKRQALDADAEKKKIAKSSERPSKRRKRLTAAEKGIIPGTTPKAGRKKLSAIAARVGFLDEATDNTLATPRPRRQRTSTAKAADAAQQEDLDLEDAPAEPT
ncbi:uncharacterized protein MYCFIDRAFT_81394 [Pseudocercospora fijiensis CIRAD86]|uniref:Transcription factor TFIIIC triple barrel domain-containing protein n=1 Tax=Pseudocercospora fijiensis (strain CIRAD86) TaxID=383855 RepID=M3A9L7_PSEFD|nr:uncharacterized protein MYCFIDRAFT_81394 [Pseudocercospora fijiensis CIRAD86]EME81326.1 hypothetical protein MYCFIDRAFT_81394 [Pseudocercospora fijiensis CIRAD86]